ncbi:DegV family protein [Chloroflexota bacterium]
MAIKIVTDSTADLSPELIEEFGITVVPLSVCFGTEVYRDREEISEDDFYQRLLQDPTHPTTTQPTPRDFADVYNKLSKQADGIISIHISEKLSGTCNSALQGKNLMENGCPIEVIDSKTTSMALGLLVIAAANIAKTENNLPRVVEALNQIVSSVKLLVLFDTLKYLAKGGRIGKAKSLLGSVLSVRPILTIKDGEFVPVGQVRSRSKGIERLVNFVKDTPDIEDLAVVHSTTPDEARSLAERIGLVLNPKQVSIARLGPVLGVHGGPGVLAIALRIK